MSELSKQSQNDLEKVKQDIEIGGFYFDSRAERIIKIIRTEEAQYKDNPPYLLYVYKELIDFPPIKLSENESKSTYKDLSNYYDVLRPIKDLDSLYTEGEFAQINGIDDDVEEDHEIGMSTELVAMNSKENLVAMKEGIERFQEKKSELRRIITFQIEQKKKKFNELRQKLDRQMCTLQKQVEKIQRVIIVIELYLGIEEELVQLQIGPAADEKEPLTLRQQILYMDEEVGLLEDQGIDFTNIEKFDEWLLKDKHYDLLLPEKKSIVAFKPRRKSKVYYDAYDRKREENDVRNKMPYFLIRNGENIYRIYSNHMTLPNSLFPKRKEFQELIESMRLDEGNTCKYDKEKIENMTYLYQKIVFLIQGLIDRTEIFHPMKKVNLMKMEEQDQNIRLIYDDELCLPTNRLPFSQWKKIINESIQVGSRIIWSWSASDEYTGFRKRDHRRRFLKYYASDYAIPDLPSSGLYVVSECFESIFEWVEGGENDSKKRVESKKVFLCIKYNPGGNYWTWNGYYERKNNVSFKIDPKDDSEILNYDRIDLDDVEFYLNSRVDRANYLQYLPVLKLIKKNLIKEQEQEDHFILMLIGRCQSKGLFPKDGLTYESIMSDLIDWWKFKNKWKRPINNDDSLAMKMIEKRLFAKTNKNKWFK